MARNGGLFALGVLTWMSSIVSLVTTSLVKWARYTEIYVDSGNRYKYRMGLWRYHRKKNDGGYQLRYVGTHDPGWWYFYGARMSRIVSIMNILFLCYVGCTYLALSSVPIRVKRAEMSCGVIMILQGILTLSAVYWFLESMDIEFDNEYESFDREKTDVCAEACQATGWNGLIIFLLGVVMLGYANTIKPQPPKPYEEEIEIPPAYTQQSAAYVIAQQRPPPTYVMAQVAPPATVLATAPPPTQTAPPPSYQGPPPSYQEPPPSYQEPATTSSNQEAPPSYQEPPPSYQEPPPKY